MIVRRRKLLFSALLALTAFAQRPSPSGQYAASLLAGLQWRDVGPMRAGRTFGVSGHADQPNTFYMGSVGGGVWKTENAGRTWYPISDEGIPIGSIGAIAVAPSNANVVYVGTGESDIRSQNSYGIGMFKSTNAGKTWTHIGLDNTRQIGRVVVDPKDANRVYVAALGHIYAPNPDRGVYRSTDGGANWKKVLFDPARPNDVGAVDLAIDPKNPRTIYASLWGTRRPPWSVYAPANLPGGGLFKSTDGGDTWKKLTGGLPTDDFVGRIGIAIAPSNPRILWAVVDDLGSASPPPRPGRGAGGSTVPDSNPAAKPTGGIYVSNDAGATWRQISVEARLGSRGWYFNSVAIDPVNPDRAYIINTATYMTTDGGKTFVPIKGAPGGDDYHQLWINPKDGNRMVLSSDQGTVVSVDGGETWSTWYNQPTAQIYHVSADNRFPHWLYGAQQDSGGVGVSTMSREGVLSFRDWEPTCLAGESNTVVPDPKDGNILYGSGDQRCDQALNVPAPLGGELPPADPKDPNRKTWTLPQVFSLADEALYYSNQFVFRSRDRGKSWEKISPDLARVNPQVPPNLDPATAKDIDQPMTDRFGVVYSIGPSPLQAATVWVGTDDGLIYVTHDDGKNWNNVTPPPMTVWSKVSQIEAGHFAAETAYASVDRHRLDDYKPYIYRTHDSGKTWQNVTAGIPDGAYVNSVKEDTKAKGLLYAATELRVYVSFNDGDEWQPLQNNMPVTSIRDIVVHGDDLAIATHGRGFWVLDQMTPLREIAAQGPQIVSSNAWLFKPGETYAVRQGNMNGTPLPHEEPQLANPPAGVVLYYSLKSAASKPLKLELLNSDGSVRACAASDTPVKPVDTEAINVQAIWEQPPQPPSAAAGTHRLALGGGGGRVAGGGGRGAAAPPPVDACTSSTSAPSAGRGGGRGGSPALQPGQYTARLTVDGSTYTQPVTVKPDPREPAPPLTAASGPAGADPIAIMVSRLDLGRYKATIKGLTQFGDRRQGTDRNRAAIDWIEAQLKSYGCTNTERVHFDYEPPAAGAGRGGNNNNDPVTGPGGSRRRGYRIPEGVNNDPLQQPDLKLRELNSQPSAPGPREEVYCTKIGSTHPEEMYIVAAHMDGIGFGEAANDDGSGTALVMELTRIFSSPDVQTERSIRFALWNNEETGLSGARAYVDQRKALQGIESPPGSGQYPEPKWLAMIQHDMMMFDHGMPLKDGTMRKEQRLEADINIEYQYTSKFSDAAMALAHKFQLADDKYATDYPANVGPHMTNTDSTPFMDLTPAISLREDERGAQLGNGWDPQHHKATDVYSTYNDDDFRLGLNATQTTLGAIAQLTGAKLAGGK